MVFIQAAVVISIVAVTAIAFGAPPIAGILLGVVATMFVRI